MPGTPNVNPRVWLWLIAAIAAGAWIGSYLGRPPSKPAVPSLEAYSEFNLPAAPATAAGPVASYTSRFEAELKAREPGRRAAGGGLAGLVPERARDYASRAPGPRPAEGGAPASAQAQSANERQREQEFLRKHDAEIQSYQQRLKGITDRYWKRSAIVREVDKEFARMDRWMALKRQYAADHDAFKWARAAVSLPEVRSAVKKYAARPEVWSVGFEMMLEALKTPPPKPIQEEMKRFLTTDRQVAGYVADFAADVVPKLTTMLPQAVPAGKDITPLIDLANQIQPGQPPVLPPRDSRTRRR